MTREQCDSNNYKWCAHLPPLPTSSPPPAPGPAPRAVEASLGDKVRGELYLRGISAEEELLFSESTKVRKALIRAIAALLGMSDDAILIDRILSAMERRLQGPGDGPLRRLAVEMLVKFVVLLPSGADPLATQNQLVDVTRHDEFEDHIRNELQAEGLTYQPTISRVNAEIQLKPEDVQPQASPSKSVGGALSSKGHLASLAALAVAFAVSTS